jgi:ribosome recycling factor
MSASIFHHIRCSSLLRQYISSNHYASRVLPHSAALLSSNSARRTYAVKAKSGKGPKSTANLIPKSKQPITDPVAQEEYNKAEQKMSAAVEWFRKECASVEARASGRVTPAVLAPVRVQFSKDDRMMKLEEVATVGVRNGSELVITVFEEEVEKFFVAICLRILKLNAVTVFNQ